MGDRKVTIQTRINRQNPSLSCALFSLANVLCILSFLRLVTPLQSSLCLPVSAEVMMTGNFCWQTGFITCIIYSNMLNHISAPLTAAASYNFKSSNKPITQNSIPPTIPPSKPTIHPKSNQHILISLLPTVICTSLEPPHCAVHTV